MSIDAFDFSTINPLRERLCLDFANSTPNHHDLSEDYLKSYADLVSWSLDVNLVSDGEAQRLWDVADRHPAKVAAVHRKAVALREAIYRILSATASSQSPEEGDLNILNAALAEAMAHMRLTPAVDGLDWEWVDGANNLESMLWPVTWSAAELLMSDDLQHLRKCEGCDWLFLDTSRSRRRRWCNMRTCGNRAKAKRHYERSRGQ